MKNKNAGKKPSALRSNERTNERTIYPECISPRPLFQRSLSLFTLSSSLAEMHKIFYNSILRLTFLLSLLISLFLSFSLSFFKDTARELASTPLYQASKINRRRFFAARRIFQARDSRISLVSRVELQVREDSRADRENFPLLISPFFLLFSLAR